MGTAEKRKQSGSSRVAAVLSLEPEEVGEEKSNRREQKHSSAISASLNSQGRRIDQRELAVKAEEVRGKR